MDHAGTTIKAMRTALGLSQEELSRLADVDQGYLSRVEAGDRSPSRRWMRDVSQALVDEMTRRRGESA